MLAQQEKVAWADGLAFIAPIHFCSFPAILKGWIDRVWTLDFAYGLTSAGWHGFVSLMSPSPWAGALPGTFGGQITGR